MCVGLPKDVAWRNATVHTGVWKQAVSGPRMVRRLNIDGDGQGDLGGHGGEQRAVLVYQMDSYRHWQAELGRDDFVYGQFGENFTVDGLADDEVCIGDRYRIGGARFEVTQPRVTCYRVGLRLDEPRMAALMVSHRRPGFYLRVLTEGEVEAGDEIVKVESGPEGMTVAEIDALLYLPGHPRDQIPRALRIPALSPGWKASLQEMLDRGDTGSGGNVGLNPAAASPPPAWSGFRDAAGGPARRGDRDGRVAVARRNRRRHAAPGRTTGPVRHAAPAPGRRFAAADPQLLALVRSRHRGVPHQREARARGTRQQLRARPPPGRRRRRGRGPARRVHARRGRRAGAAALGRHRRDPGAGDAPRARRGGRPHARSGGCTARATGPSTRSPRKPRRCWRSSRTRTSTSATAAPVPTTGRAKASRAWAGSRPRSSSSSASRATPTPISAGRPRSWTGSAPRSPRSASIRSASTPRPSEPSPG